MKFLLENVIYFDINDLPENNFNKIYLKNPI